MKGTYPTPVQRLDRLGTARATLWVKRDDVTHPIYGGNKVRKLEKILAGGLRPGLRRLVTVGAAGSHHVLATALAARERGLEVDAVLVPQVRSEHVVENLRAMVGLGVRIVTARTYAAAFLAELRLRGSDALSVPVGGTSVRGALGYVEAARELCQQIEAGALPRPDAIVITLGSGGSAAGLAAGLASIGWARTTQVVAIAVTEPAWAVAAGTHALAWQLRGGPVRLAVDGRYLGGGYGHPTPSGERAMETAASEGLTLDATYTAKSFAAALDRVRSGRHRSVLYWHTLSSAPMAPLLVGAPSEDELEARLRRLLL